MSKAVRKRTRIRPLVMACILLILALLSSQRLFAYDALIEITTQQLPFNTTLQMDIQGTINQTLNVTYDNWISGPASIIFTDPLYQLSVRVNIPQGTPPGNYTRTIILQNNQTRIEKTILISIRNGQIDNDNDNYSPPADCNDNDPLINPGMPEIYYNGKDDDCNPLTEDNFRFMLELSDREPDIGERINLRIYAINGSSISVEICEQGQGFVPCYYPLTLPNVTYPHNMLLPYTNSTGAYIITGRMNYQGIVKTYELAYVVQNSIQATITGERTADINEILSVRASGSGGIPPYSYTWTLPEKSALTGPEANFSYSSPGERIGQLKIRDKENNELNISFDITIKKTYPVTILVADNDTGARIPDVKITVRDKEAQTNGNGETAILLSEGTYTFSALKDGYDIFNTRYRIDGATNFTMRLIRKDIEPPVITIQTPANNSITASKDITFTFTIQDITTTTCELYTGKLNETFLMLKNKSTFTPGTPHSHTYTITDGQYKWKVDCYDSKRNKGTTGILYFDIRTDGTITENPQVREADHTPNREERGNLIQGLYDALDRIPGFTFKEQQAAEFLSFEKKIRDALKTIDRVNRDISDLKHRLDLTNEQKETKSLEFIKKVDDIYSTVPINIIVNKDKTFMKYPTEDDIKAFMDALYPQHSNGFYNFIKQYQQKLSASTTTMQVTVEYIDGSKKEVTLVAKELRIQNLSQEDLLYELIPEDVANINEVNFQQSSTRSPQGLFQFEYDPANKYVIYQIDKIVNLADVERFNTLIINKKITPDANIPTGRAILSFNENLNLKNLLILLAIILCAAFVLHHTEGIDKIKDLIRRDSKNLSYATVLLNDVKDTARAGNVHDAIVLFDDLKTIYTSLQPPEQQILHEELLLTASLLDKAHLKDLIKRCESHASENEIGLAVEEYTSMNSIFALLSEQDKEELYQDIIQLHNMLQGKINQ